MMLFLKRSFIVFFESGVLLAISLSFLASAMIVWLIMRPMISKAHNAGKAAREPEIKQLNTIATERDEVIRLLESQLSDITALEKQLKDDCSRLEKNLAVEQQKNNSMSEIKEDLSQSEKQYRELEKELRTLTADLAREKGLTRELSRHRERSLKRCPNLPNFFCSMSSE